MPTGRRGQVVPHVYDPQYLAISCVPRGLTTEQLDMHLIVSYTVITVAVYGEIAVCTSSIRHLRVAYNLYT